MAEHTRDRFIGAMLQVWIVAIAFVAGLLLQFALVSAPIVSKNTSNDMAFLQFVPFAICLAAAIFLSFRKEKSVLYRDEVDFGEQSDPDEPATEDSIEGSVPDGKDNDTEIPKG